MNNLISFIAFGVMISVGKLAISAEDTNDPAPAVQLNDFGRYQSKPLTRGAEVDESDLATTNVSNVIENVINSKIQRWNADGILRGKKTLIVQPEIVELRLGNRAIVRNSKFKLRLHLTDSDSGEIVGRPEFTEGAGAIAALFTKGRSDAAMYNEVIKAASAYLDGSYQTAVDEALRERQEAIGRYTAAAEQGNAIAQLTLGNMYSAGQDVAQADKEAFVWWEKSAAQGNTEAQMKLGWAYANGRGTKQDDHVAVTWWREAAERGSAQAQMKLGWMYQNGRGVARSEADAIAWYRKAADQGDETAKVYVARSERGTRRFSSFDDARTALNPADGLDVALMTNPMSLKGRILAVRLEIIQVLGNGRMLMTNPYLGVSQLDGKIYYAEIAGAYAGSREFVDGQQVAVIGEVTGPQQYTTAIGAPKTVPKIVVYGIRPGW